MFQTEIIHFIQSFETDLLTKIFLFFTSLGYKEFFLGFVIIFIFGIDFKKGLVLTHVIIITGLITELLKQLFALPRPYHVDNNIKTLWTNDPNGSKFSNGGAESFFGLPADQVIQFYRNKVEIAFGLPSGHTSTATAIWGSLIILYKNIWIRSISVLMIIAIPFLECIWEDIF
jgi:membrane-associated phospholipid phosphatase